MASRKAFRLHRKKLEPSTLHKIFGIAVIGLAKTHNEKPPQGGRADPTRQTQTCVCDRFATFSGVAAYWNFFIGLFSEFAVNDRETHLLEITNPSPKGLRKIRIVWSIVYLFVVGCFYKQPTIEHLLRAAGELRRVFAA